MSLDDASIDAMGDEELRSEMKALRDRYRAMHRRAQHSITARDRAEVQRRLDREVSISKRRIEAWHFEFKRVCQSHSIVKKMFEAAARKLGLPHGRYHSVNDLPFRGPYDGNLYANVYLTPQGGIETFNVLDVVEQAIGNASGADKAA